MEYLIIIYFRNGIPNKVLVLLIFLYYAITGSVRTMINNITGKDNAQINAIVCYLASNLATRQ